MNIVVLTGSARKNGCSCHLAEQFIKGAEEAGHEVVRFDTTHLTVNKCLSCMKCGMGQNPCVWKDDMVEIGQAIIKADAVVFAAPMYYHGLPMSLKAVVDRFFHIDSKIHGGKKAVMLMSAGSAEDWNFDAIKAWFKTDMRYLGWDIAGELYAAPLYTPADESMPPFAQKAYEMGKNL